MILLYEMVYHRAKLHLGPNEKTVLLHGGTVKVPKHHYGVGSEIHLTTGQMRKMLAGAKSGRGFNLKMSRGQINHHGRGFFDSLISGAKSLLGSDVGKTLLNSGIQYGVSKLPKSAQNLANSNLGQALIGTAANALTGGRVRTAPKRKGVGVRKGRTGKGFLGDIAGALGGPLAGGLAGAFGLGVKRQRRGRGMAGLGLQAPGY